MTQLTASQQHKEAYSLWSFGPPAQQALQARSFHPSGQWEEFPESALEQSVVARFEEIVARYSDRVALKMGNERVTYFELNCAANRVAHTILQTDGPGAKPVALLFDQGIPVIVAKIGVLKAGKFYAPLDPLYPPARLQRLLRNVQASLILTNNAQLHLAQQIAGPEHQIVNLDAIAREAPSHAPALAIAPDALAYLTFTSGSTGEPKGIVEDHGNVLRTARLCTSIWHICPEDCIGLSVRWVFGNVPTRIYSALLTGATLSIYDTQRAGVGGLSEWLATDGVTIAIAPVSMFRALPTSWATGRVPARLRIIGMGGEPPLSTDVKAFQARMPVESVLHFIYGSSEVMISAEYLIGKETPFDEAVVPAGYATGDREVFILDQEGEQCAPGEVGEIVIRSQCMTLGYWGDPELTQAKFTIDPENPQRRFYRTGDMGRKRADGCLEHCGRKDSLAKVRGNRVDTNEIEVRLLSFPGVHQAAVVARQERPGETYLAAYIVYQGEAASPLERIRRHLAETLPEFMLPTAFVFLAQMPMTATHKINRRLLPAPARQRPSLANAYRPPENPLEQLLVTLWQDVLPVEPIGIDDDFFALGGDSLHAMMVINRLRQRFDELFHLSTLFRSPTVRSLGQVLQENYPTVMDWMMVQVTTAAPAEPGEKSAPILPRLERSHTD